MRNQNIQKNTRGIQSQFRSAKGLEREQGGQALVELALILPIIIMLIYAILHIGLALNIKNQLVFAANQGAYVGSLTNNDARITSMIQTSFASPDLKIEIKNFTADNPAVPLATGQQRIRNDYVVVELTYTYKTFYIPFTGISKNIDLKARAASRIVCYPDPSAIPPNTCP